jgi:hypothetical protein
MPATKGFLVVSASFFRPVSRCKTLTARLSEINSLQTNTNHSTQHGGNTAVHFPFAKKGKPAGVTERPGPFS